MDGGVNNNLFGTSYSSCVDSSCLESEGTPIGNSSHRGFRISADQDCKDRMKKVAKVAALILAAVLLGGLIFAGGTFLGIKTPTLLLGLGVLFVAGIIVGLVKAALSK